VLESIAQYRRGAGLGQMSRPGDDSHRPPARGGLRAARTIRRLRLSAHGGPRPGG